MPLPRLRSNIVLVGAGVVGQAILKAHVATSKSVCLVDQDRAAVVQAVQELRLADDRWDVSSPVSWNEQLSAIEIVHRTGEPETPRKLVIESIAERLDVKQSLLSEAERWFGEDAILCSNTSTLRIDDIASALEFPQRFGGMHFFMPVDQRDAVEAIRGTMTSDATMKAISRHIEALLKRPLVANDGPGFIVNRMLSPYLNEAMLMLSRGIGGERIERAASCYGMPISPLELIDWIGTRTTFDAGRVFWQAFPQRIEPSPIAPAMLKRERFGRTSGGGFYDYLDGTRSSQLSPIATDLADMYCREPIELSDSDILHLLSVPMWIEAVLAARQGIVHALNDFELAMQGGLGFDAARSWSGFFDSIGSETIRETSKRWSPLTAAVRIPSEICDGLRDGTPAEVLKRALDEGQASMVR